MCQKHSGDAELFIKVNDESTNMSVDLMSHPVKVSVDKEFISYLEELEGVKYVVN